MFDSEEPLSIQHIRSSWAEGIWNGIIEYSYDNKEWKEWHEEEIINNKIYMRGINNTVVSGGNPWIINGKNIKCQGNIENLLDYKSVINNIHPKMDCDCFASMFAECIDLIEMPQLLSTELSRNCYQSMFWKCISLTKVTPLLALQLVPNCYLHMFCDCSSLSITAEFPNLEMAKKAIINQRMFWDCPISFVNINNKLYDINVLKLL